MTFLMPIQPISVSDQAARPVVGITVGDVAGVGPELALRCVNLPEVKRRCNPILYGPTDALRRIARQLPQKIEWQTTAQAIHDIGRIDVAALQAGRFTSQTGQASFEAVDAAIADAIAKKLDAIVTGPIQKQAWHLAGISFPGHTELLAQRTRIDDYCMMLTSPEISCVLATIHIPLADVGQRLSVPLIHRTIRLGAAAITARLGRPARVVVCGFNPHAGEDGLFSHGEERELIQPAIAAARNDGLEVTGPIPPDTAFTPRIRSQTDLYVCMYHDQGLIPLKALAFDDAVNVTLGLPIIRTSVDHGTALDLAWQGTANHQSMLAAISMAIDLARSPAISDSALLDSKTFDLEANDSVDNDATREC